MSEEKKKGNLWPVVLISVIILASTVVYTAVKVQTAQEAGERTHEHMPVSEKIEGIKNPKPGLSEIISQRQRWDVAYHKWIGKAAPDFTVTDLEGKVHKLSDYRGKNVMLVFWATWCAPCISEVPHIKALKTILGEDKLKILGISYVTPNNLLSQIKGFAEQYKINYSVAATPRNEMPAPFSQINGIPCSFFIDPAGNIKLATEGTLSLGEMKAIVLSESQ
ncbi:MAG: TlpA family protein disulfide reductase [Planctomycetes bacterium]|nr:TlpA family protein disulfide reductase [Planctomycetota bacterium]